MEKQIRMVALKRGMKLKDIAEKTGMTQSNLGAKMKRDNFPEKELRQIADALDCDLIIKFKMRDTGEEI